MISCLLTEQSKTLQKKFSYQKEIQNTNLNVEKSIQFLSAQNEELQKKIQALEKQSKDDNKQYIKHA